jgi:inorganic phosphate transporter, PiT family
LILLSLIAAVLLLAYANGANDNFKGVATLYGSGTTSYRRALAWATVATLVGSLLALLLASGLVEAFKGKGLVPDAVALDPLFLLAVSLGAASTVLLATVTGLPVSTTHALIGGLAGAGLMATGGQIAWPALLKAFLLPMLVSPVLSVLLTLGLYPLLHRLRRTLGVERDSCLCVGGRDEPVRIAADGTMTLARTGMAIEAGRAPECRQRYSGRVLGWEAGRMLDGLHFLSGGAVCLARGLNDTPKIVALLLGAQALSPRFGLALVAIAMALGGVLNARKVADTISHRITAMTPGQGLSGNLVTALLVTVASRLGLPVSTTHVSVGALFGIGLSNGSARWAVVRTILLAWLTTLPLGALLAALAYAGLRLAS